MRMALLARSENRLNVERYPRTYLRIGKDKGRWHDADDGERRRVEADVLPNDVGASSEMLQPEAVRQDDERRAPPVFFTREESPPERRRGAHQGKKAPRDGRPTACLWAPRPRHGPVFA